MASRLVSLTGATGFLGWHIAEAFRDAGWRVRAIVRSGRATALPEAVEHVEAQLSVQGGDLERALEGCDAVVHAAGVVRGPSPSDFDMVNVEGTRAVVNAANGNAARLVLISSQAATGPGTLGRPAREDDAPRPVNAYGRSKLAGEAVVRSCARMPWTILRPTSVFGPRDRAFLPLFKLAARGVFLLPVDPRLPVTFLYVEDLARAVVLAAEDPRARGQTLFLGHREPLTAEELLRGLADTFGRRYRPVPVPRWALSLAGAAGDLLWRVGRVPPIDSARVSELKASGFVCAVERAREVLDFTADVTLGEGIERTARWYRERDWL